MKGFVRLLEAVIASIILIASISYFFVPAAPQSSWDDTMAVIRARESLMSMEKSGRLADYVARNDVAAINADLRKSVPSNIEFSVEIRDIANGIIFVECFCTEAEKSSVESLLSPLRFNYNGRDIEIRVQQLANLNSINANTNVLLIIGYENLNAYRASLDSFLERGGTIFMLSSLYENQVNDGYMDSVFGLRWGDSGGGSGRFYDTTTPSKVSYKVANYYLALRKEDASAAAFSGFSGEGVNQVVVDDRSVVVSSPANVIS
ncbi:MAG: hypothetical protein HY368_00490, partial [Candidatus Aenigmarchaeota archaeon]|nr:hypothetical protein [Candidatus Aenigmarchaeota archaeon]